MHGGHHQLKVKHPWVVKVVVVTDWLPGSVPQGSEPRGYRRTNFRDGWTQKHNVYVCARACAWIRACMLSPRDRMRVVPCWFINRHDGGRDGITQAVDSLFPMTVSSPHY